MGRLGARSRLAGLVAASWLLRVALVARGGQMFWPDESRYRVSQAAAAAWHRGEWLAGIRLLLATADHLLFKVIGVLPALAESFGAPPYRFAAGFFALFSAGVIAWVWAIARRAGGSEREAWAAAVLAACSTCLFYYARHLFPYDAALFFLLGGLHAGLRPGGRAALAAGAWVGLGFLTYNAYWQIGGAILLVVARFEAPGRARLRRAAAAGAGLLLPLAVVAAAGKLAGVDLVASGRAFAGTADVGNLDLGWRFVGEYFWAAEHGLALLWLAAAAGGVTWLVRGGAPSRLGQWLLIAGLGYVAIAASSDIFHHFAVNARTTRGLAPFLCLAAGTILAEAGPLRRRAWLAPLVLAAAVLQAAVNFAGAFRLSFPPEFNAAADARIALFPPARRADLQVQNARYVPAAAEFESVPAGAEAVLLAAPHPLAFTPYFYEGFIRAERGRLLRADRTMRLVLLRPALAAAAAARGWNGYPGPLRLRLRLPEGRPGESEPILATGRMGAGDLLYVIYGAPGKFRIGFDHWGQGGPISPLLDWDPAAPVDLTVSFGSLYPAASSWPPGIDARLRSYLVVKVGSRTVLAQPQLCWPASAEQIAAGSNFIGASTAQPLFTGEVLAAEPAVPAELSARLPAAP